MYAGGDRDTQLPLRGAVLCFTSIDPETRTRLASWAAEMGAEHKLDLTSDVTHLIVGETQTPKYKYVAREREDVKCLDSDWVSSVRSIWMTGVDVDTEQLEHAHKLRAFHELKICITGFEDPDQRKELENQIMRHGGEYRGDLRKDCTHLVCFSPAGAKYTSARSWGNIRTVSVEWVQLSIERGLILDEQYFDPLLPPEERGQGAWKRASGSSPSSKRARVDESKGHGPRKLRRAASSRFDADAMWQDIVPAKEDIGTRSVNTNSITQAPAAREAKTTEKPHSFGATERHPSRENASNGSNSTVAKPTSRHGIFHDTKFLLHGFDTRRIQLLRQHLESQDGEVQSDPSFYQRHSNDLSSGVSFTVVPYSSCSTEAACAPQLSTSNVVTELWVEKCLHEKRVINSEAFPAYKPFKHPLKGFEKLRISCTGFEGVDLLHIGKVIALLGSSYCDGLSKNASLLVCNDESITRDKYRHALSWNIPAVGSGWLWECVHSGQLRPWSEYLVHPNLQKPTLMSKRLPAAISANASTGTSSSTDSFNKAMRPVGDTGGSAPATSHTKALYVQDTTGDKITNANVTGAWSAQAHRQGAKAETRALSSRSLPLELCTEPWDPGSAEQPSLVRLRNGNQSLVTSLNTLLARTKEQKSQTASENTPEVPRKKRQLLGRARSDLSAKSTVSRTDSLDSMNTDGVGTPIEAASREIARKSGMSLARAQPENVPFPIDMLLKDEESTDLADETEDQHPIMTQIGYDDSDAVIWRARIADKLSGFTVSEQQTNNYDENFPGLKGVLKEAGGTISKRTRMNTKS